MKMRSILVAALAAGASTFVCADSGRAPAHVPHTLAATRSAGVVARADHAFSAYLAASSSQDVRELNNALTDDAKVEYASQTPGTYRTVDGYSLLAEAEDTAVRASAMDRVSNVWIFPTGDANAVFVQYETTSDSTVFQGAEKKAHLVLLEMRGDRIAWMRSFGPQG